MSDLKTYSVKVTASAIVNFTANIDALSPGLARTAFLNRLLDEKAWESLEIEVCEKPEAGRDYRTTDVEVEETGLTPQDRVALAEPKIDRNEDGDWA